MHIRFVTCDCCNGSGFLRMPYKAEPCSFCFTLGFKPSYDKAAKE